MELIESGDIEYAFDIRRKGSMHCLPVAWRKSVEIAKAGSDGKTYTLVDVFVDVFGNHLYIRGVALAFSMGAISRMTPPIRAIAVCSTLQSAARLENAILAREIEQQPRIPEALLYLEYQSRQPGALDAVAARMIQNQGRSIGTRVMREVGPVKIYSPRQSLKIWSALPVYCRQNFPDQEAWRLELLRDELPDAPLNFQEQEQLDAVVNRAMSLPPEFRDPSCISEQSYAWLREMYYIRLQRGEAEELTLDDPVAAATLAKLTPNAFQDLCLSAAREHLARHLAILCNSPDSVLTGPWYWAELFPALLAEMDQWAKAVLGSIANTSVYKVAMDSFEFACQRKKPVRLHGETKFGKSIVAKKFCHAFPGRARYVQVPWSNREGHLMEEIGKAFGVYQTGPKAEETIETLCQTFKILIVLDEAHGLFPTKLSRNSGPGRLNWVRLELFKHDVPVALVTTPQYNQVEERFSKATEWNIDQFNGCIYQYPQLPDRITFDELVAIGQTYLPGTDPDIIGLVAAEAEITGQYLIYFGRIAENAAWLAQRAGRAEITEDDIRCAVIMSTPPAKPVAPAKSPADTTKPAKKDAGRTGSQKSATMTLPPRGAKPDSEETGPDPRALPAAPARQTSLLVSAPVLTER
jgi:hypothetical protein